MIQTQIDSVPTSAPVAASEQGGGDVVGARASIIINIDGCEPIVLPSIAKAIQLRDALNALIGQPPQLTIDLPANPSIMPYKIARDPEWVVTYRKLE